VGGDPALTVTLGILGGSGIQAMAALAGARRTAVETPWGPPSGELLESRIAGLPVVFLARHGPGHRILPNGINYRANIAALKQAGCTAVLALSACGSFREDLPPGHLCLVDQIVDRTHGRARSFFGDGLVAHVSLAEPIAHDLVDRVADAARAINVPCRRGGTYLAMEGPQFSTRGESLLNRAAGLDVVGMTAAPEAGLAREAELAYALVAHVTDFDAWKTDAHVTTADVVAQLHANAAAMERLVEAVAGVLAARPLPVPSAQGWERALDAAIITPRSHWTGDGLAALQFLAPRFFS
jgi:5'-methylthioadenosine phosphorylase